MNPTSSPSGRSFPGLAYDSRADRVVLFGGVFMAPLDDTWTYDLATDTWTNVTPAVSPPAPWGATMVYDARWDRVVLFGAGEGYGNDTWVYDVATNTWQDLGSAGAPSPRSFPVMVYDSTADRVVLFGGYAGTEAMDDMWIYDLGTATWAQLHPAHSPPFRTQTAMAYDVLADRVVLFGGWNGTAYRLYNDTWTFDLDTQTWTNATRVHAPPPRSYHALAYDPVADRVVLFGGAGYAVPSSLNDTWSYDLATDTWTDVTPKVSPPGAVSASLVYDSAANRTILFEGDTNGALEPGTWTFQHPAVPPSPVGPFVSATPGNARVALAWSPPATDGGSPITGYAIFRGIRADAEVRVATVGDVLNYTDTGLANGVIYWYSVAAANAAGVGPRSPDRSAMPTQPGDTVAPMASFTFVANSTLYAVPTVAGNWTVYGNASDDVAVAEVLLSADGVSWVPATGTTSWSGVVALRVGENTVFVQATDPSGTTGGSEIVVWIATPSGPPPPPPVETGPPLWVWPLAAAGIAALGAAGYVWARRRRRRGRPDSP